jgi:rhomboid protease GluP
MTHYAVGVLVGINILVWIANVLSGLDIVNPDAAALIVWGGNYLPKTINEPWRLVSAMFLHGGIAHMAWNMLALVQLGVLANRFYGTPALLVIYFFAGICGNLASLFYSAKSGVSVGASGAIFGLMGAVVCALLTKAKHLNPEGVRSLLIVAGIYIVFNIYLGLTDSNIDQAAHIGGFLSGALAALGLAERFDRREYRNSRWARLGITLLLAGFVVWGIWRYIFFYYGVTAVVLPS